MLTPSGRFKINDAICLTNSHYHPESATPTWNINSMMIAFISIMMADDTTGISHIKDTKENRKRYAKESFDYNVHHHSSILKLFTVFVNDNLTKKEENHTDDKLKTNLALLCSAELDTLEFAQSISSTTQTTKRTGPVVSGGAIKRHHKFNINQLANKKVYLRTKKARSMKYRQGDKHKLFKRLTKKNI